MSDNLEARVERLERMLTEAEAAVARIKVKQLSPEVQQETISTPPEIRIAVRSAAIFAVAFTIYFLIRIILDGANIGAILVTSLFLAILVFFGIPTAWAATDITIPVRTRLPGAD